MSITIVFNCEGCGKRYELDESLAGKKAACKQCGMKFVIPVPMRPSRPAAPAPSGTAPRPAAPRRPTPPPAEAPPAFPAADLYGLDEAPLPPRASGSVAPRRPSADDDLADVLPKRASFPTRRSSKAGGPDKLKLAIGIPAGAIAFAIAFAVMFNVMKGNIDLNPGNIFASLSGDGPYDKIFEELAGLLEELGGILASIHSQPDAARHADRLREIESTARRIMSDMQAMPKPSASEDRRLMRKYESRMKKGIAKVTSEAQRLQSVAGMPGGFMPSFSGFSMPGFSTPPPFPGPRPPMGPSFGMPNIPPPPPVVGDPVEIRVTGVTDNEHAELIGEQIGELMSTQPQGNRRTFMSGSGSSRTWTVTPLPDVAAFTSAVKFGKVSSSNAKRIDIVANPLSPDQRRPPESDTIGRAVFDLKSTVSHKRTDAARRLAEALPNERREEVAEALVPVLSDTDIWARKEAVRALGVWGSSNQVPALIDRVNDSDHSVKLEAIKSLGRRADPRGAEAIVGVFEQFQSQGKDALVAIGPPAEEAVLKLLKHQDTFVRVEACKILADIGSAKSMPALQTLARRSGFDADAARAAARSIREANTATTAPQPPPNRKPAEASPTPASDPAPEPPPKPSGLPKGKTLPKGKKLGG